jgi:uncharacterized protein (DUF608 family)
MTVTPLFPFTHNEVVQAALPLGGIGAGCISFNGYGGLQDFAIHNRPAMTAKPDAHRPDDTGFALLHVDGAKPVTRLVEGPFPTQKIYDQGLQGQGYWHGGYEGLPRFAKARFRSGYPFGEVTLSDPAIPIEARVLAWNPFIPLDDVASGIPCAILEYTLKNRARKSVAFEFTYHLSHFATGDGGGFAATRNEPIPGKGIHFFNTEPAEAESHGSASLTVIGHRPRIKAMWLRGAWFDAISALWAEVHAGRFETNNGSEDAGFDGRNGGSILIAGELSPGEEITIPIVITWHFPNNNLSILNEECGDDSGCRKPRWKTFYSSQWKNARETAAYVHKHFNSLRSRTIAFQNALLSSTLPKEVLDAVSANLAILKSPTVLRQANGNIWGWEGCYTTGGCCAGTCTHVWNYAQSLPHLFPKLERTLREQEWDRSMDESGHVAFRAALPDGPVKHDFHAAADGQLGGIMKLFREWHISGDTAWMKRLYPLAKRSLEYCIGKWDPDRKGALFEPHHNTYDIEFWGPDGMCTTVYIGALSALAAMARALGETKDAEDYGELAQRGARVIEEQIFNGEYFEQKIPAPGLQNKAIEDVYLSGAKPFPLSKGMLRLLQTEGPRYQYGSGCLSDGVIGSWMAALYGIETPIDPAKVRKNLQSIHKYNFRKDLSTHANCQRPGFALGAEPGLLLCTWPRGGKPTLPFVYSDEVWTGIEYQVASHLILEGLVEEGLEIVAGVRKRYDGRVRNPWNEYECGSFYARAMSSYALLPAISGFRYSAVEKTLWFGPKIGRKRFATFFCTAEGFGSISLEKDTMTITLLQGLLDLKRVVLTRENRTVEYDSRQVVRAGKPVVFQINQTMRKGPVVSANARRNRATNKTL